MKTLVQKCSFSAQFRITQFTINRIVSNKSKKCVAYTLFACWAVKKTKLQCMQQHTLKSRVEEQKPDTKSSTYCLTPVMCN